MTRLVTVLAPGPLATVQDEGRPGLGALGIGRSGAFDRASARLANRLVGNPVAAAVLEVTFGAFRLRAEDDVLAATAGARCAGPAPHVAPFTLRAGQELHLGAPATGARTYLALRGGVMVAPALGSRSSDTLAGLGPAVLRAGDRLPVGEPVGPAPAVDVAPVAEPTGAELTVSVLTGPRRDWFTAAAWLALTGSAYTVSSDSDRVGLRLTGPVLPRARPGELVSEPAVRGALQVPASGLPVLFGADHPVTGGYPVIAYVVDEDVDRCAQLRPGQSVRFRQR